MSSAPHPVRRPAGPPVLARLALVVTAVLTVLTGCSSTPDKAAPAAADSPAAVGSPSPGAAGAERPAAVPTKVSIPSIGITSSLMKLGLNADRTVEVPPAEKGMTAGWYVGGSVPGEVGPAVIIGHNDTRFGKAVFHDLGKITKGADITVTDSRGASARFTVTGTQSVSKNSFPTEKVYGPTDERALRLVTCDGDFDAQGHPVNNLIVYAKLA
ncbi:sortase (surface protein transpeptidase) [Streptomyces aurantiacus]|uniref:class F sortase n=1 Tax=Streptomyces aurantiacus TaxID=47760 RepID=UPI00278DF19A|nr:class F sortase [Streptomyces aurantiacus]MDQ0779287.1 sortase (surface protein transpeptidase) [Streptomyces aurantiacus]